ncbi:hypothetical protein [Roseateles asaccharophilus]|uniref:ATP-binding protein n=1 Tax=Roseateles asaccharophilus TaxID=582607 RepID=A0ABU2AAZ1_9BURK|nr:hypothetical protein [Roseateles asaccharophilus]MDR7334336.1 hypothetical protein [Roseateles asaccharophilus]
MNDFVDSQPESDVEVPSQSNVGTDLRDAVLLPGLERDTYFKTHPLNRRPVEIRTQSIETAFLDVTEAVTYRQLGLCFKAPFRVGKSTAALMLSLNIRSTVEDLAVHLVVAKVHDKVSERVFFGDLCDSMKLTSGGTAVERGARVRKAILAACLSAECDQFLLIIDEGQNWGAREWEWLRDMSNELLNIHKITLTTAIFADSRIEETRSNFREKRQDLWGRFMMKLRTFTGIRDVGELRYFLSMLDDADKYQFPKGSGISYTEFYLPKAFEDGWRLADQAEEIWQAFERAANEVNRKIGEIGMQWVSDTIVDFLKNQSAGDFSGFGVDKDAWDVSVASSRYVESLV